MTTYAYKYLQINETDPICLHSTLRVASREPSLHTPRGFWNYLLHIAPQLPLGRTTERCRAPTVPTIPLSTLSRHSPHPPCRMDALSFYPKRRMLFLLESRAFGSGSHADKTPSSSRHQPHRLTGRGRGDRERKNAGSSAGRARAKHRDRVKASASTNDDAHRCARRQRADARCNARMDCVDCTVMHAPKNHHVRRYPCRQRDSTRWGLETGRGGGDRRGRAPYFFAFFARTVPAQSIAKPACIIKTSEAAYSK